MWARTDRIPRTAQRPFVLMMVALWCQCAAPVASPGRVRDGAVRPGDALEPGWPDGALGDKAADLRSGAEDSRSDGGPGPSSCSPPSGSAFGFNYWPRGMGPNVLHDRTWASKRAEVERDLDLMVSLGARVVRLMFWPNTSGYLLSTERNGGGTINVQQLAEVQRNLPELLSLFQRRCLRVTVAFGNYYLSYSTSSGSLTQWQHAYGATAAGLQAFIAHSGQWMRGIVASIEQSPFRDAVIYYDLQNEYRHYRNHTDWAVHPGSDEYVTSLYDAGIIPSGKRGQSILWTYLPGSNHPADAEALKAVLGQRVLDYVEFHHYPHHKPGVTVAATFAKLEALFPGAVISFGELGYPSNLPSEEEQASQVLELLQDVADVNQQNQSRIAYALHWMLWDGTPPSSTNPLGFALDPQHPKDVLGRVAALHGLIANSDLEQVTASGTPFGWTAGGTVPASFAAVQDPNAAATGRVFGRVEVKSRPAGKIWLCSRRGEIQGQRRLYLSFYFRTSGAAVRAGIHEYDGAGNDTTTAGPSAAPLPSSLWTSYLDRTGSWSLPLKASTREVAICLTAEVPAQGTQYLELDAVSAAAR